MHVRKVAAASIILGILLSSGCSDSKSLNAGRDEYLEDLRYSAYRCAAEVAFEEQLWQESELADTLNVLWDRSMTMTEIGPTSAFTSTSFAQFAELLCREGQKQGLEPTFVDRYAALAMDYYWLAHNGDKLTELSALRARWARS